MTIPLLSSPLPASHLVAIAASVGGLTALSHILQALPSDLRAAIAVVLHTPPNRHNFIAEILNRRTTLEVKEASAGALLRPGMVSIRCTKQGNAYLGQRGRLVVLFTVDFLSVGFLR